MLLTFLAVTMVKDSVAQLDVFQHREQPPSNTAAASMSGEHSAASTSSPHPTKTYVS